MPDKTPHATMFTHHRSTKRSVTALAAFSLIELVVVIGIFSIMSLVVLANHSRFNSSVLLGSLAYNIALSVREAQVYGLSVQQHGTNFQVGYGVHFSSPSSYVFFADTNANKRYDSTTDSIVKSYTLNNQHQITRFCGVTVGGSYQCSDTSGSAQITYLDIVFFRPDPDANMASESMSDYSRSEIKVTSGGGETRTITIASTGQISVTNP